MTRVVSRVALLAWLVMCGKAAVSAQVAAATPGLATTLSGLAARVEEYYSRISTIICVETVTQQQLKFNLAPAGKPRVTVNELSVTHDPRGKGDREFRVDRTLQFVNGKRAKKHEMPGCTDPKTGTPEPLGFLLAKNQPGYRFSWPREAAGGPEATLALDFAQSPPERVNITWEGDCFEADGGGIEGRVWFDPHTFDVLQIQAKLPKPFLVPIPHSLGGPPPSVRVERSEMLLRFTRVKFQQPDEMVLLPESIEVLTVFRGVPSLRTIQVLSNFRRFLAESVVRPSTM
jgi:hypothetical protein